MDIALTAALQAAPEDIVRGLTRFNETRGRS
jgi:hypothetical protein